MIHLKPSVHLALFPKAAIALQIRQGKYLIYGAEVAQAIADELDNNPSRIFHPCLKHLQTDGVLAAVPASANQSKLYDYRDMVFHGFSTAVWSQRQFAKQDVSQDTNILDLFHVSATCLFLKLRGFRAIETLSNKRHSNITSAMPSVIANEVARLHKSLLWSPFKIACLEWSFAVVSRLRARGISAKLIVGVRPMPFLAHAWPEVDGQVIADAPDLRSIYGVIYESL